MTVLAPTARTFTLEESSAIHKIEVDYLTVLITYQSNTDKVYKFTATSDFSDTLMNLLESDEITVSLGSLIADARKSGDLEQVEN